MKLSQEDLYQIKALERRIIHKDLDAMFEYACLYQNKFREEVTDEIAQKMVYCYENCMNEGNLTAALNLGAMYYGGEFIPRNFRKAIEYYKLAAKSDDDDTKIRALCNLGYCYYYGRDIPIDNEKAFNCFMRGALSNDANSLYKLGDMYRYGRFVEKDEETAAFLYERAFEETYKNDDVYSDICMRIGECNLYGIGMERDIIRAFELLTAAEIANYKKILDRDPFAKSVLPKIQKLLAEARELLQEQL